MTTAVPTKAQGYVDPYAIGEGRYSSLYLDLLEHVPDLTFPLSIPIYARMRKDPKLAAIEAGWVLNLLRAQWQLDPAGCRPEVVQAVADGLGIAVMGKDKAGPARLRGVSWGDHLRAALRMIPFGFSPFELEADTSSGQAKLSGLWERPPWTFSNLRVDGKTGLLTGADQDVAWKSDSPQMLAQNMAWYVRGREGANWAGTSLFRPSYASWLIKEEVRRHYGAANVRWSTGIPVMEALPGTNPTPGQMAEAQQMASASRGGITAGASSPPGFSMKIMGISGSLPDSQGFLQWLDQQMSASALLGVLDLGDTSNGSRALGEVFLDVFHLALEAEGDAVADTATRQIAARIVDWNFGEDEPVPRVVVSGIGSRREVTAESLQLLLTSGALAADPRLEEWVRREYRLPERDPDTPWESPKPKIAPPAVAQPTEVQDGNPASGKDDGTKKPADVAAAQQLTLFPDGVAASEDHHHGKPHFDPGQKRDGDGKWTRGGGPGKAGSATEPAKAKPRALRVRAALAKARTLGEVEQVAQTEARRVRGDRYGETTFSFTSDNPVGLWEESAVATAREHAEGVLRVIELFPRADISRVRVAHPREDEVLAATNPYAYARGNEIVFNLAWSASAYRRTYLSRLRSDAAAQWHVPNSGTPIAVGIHEAAHVVDLRTLSGVSQPDSQLAYRDAFRAYEKTGKRQGAPWPVSVYADTNSSELVAESATDAIVNGEGAAAVSKKVFGSLVDSYDEAVTDNAAWARGLR